MVNDDSRRLCRRIITNAKVIEYFFFPTKENQTNQDILFVVIFTQLITAAIVKLAVNFPSIFFSVYVDDGREFAFSSDA